jgi:thioredoxin-related protein
LYIILPTIWISMFLVFLKLQKQLNYELLRLPSGEQQKEVILKHPIIGKNIGNKLVDNHLLSSPFSIIIIVNQTCSFCLTELEELIHENQNYQLPIFNVISIENKNEVNESTEKYDLYQKDVTQLQVKQEMLAQLEIHDFPTLLLVDHNGIVLGEFGWYRGIFHQYNFILKGGEVNVE